MCIRHHTHCSVESVMERGAAGPSLSSVSGKGLDTPGGGSSGSSIQIIFFFWTCSWTVHEHVQKMFKSLEISKYSQQEFEHVHEQFMNKLDNPWTVHELRPSAGVVRSTFFCGVSRNFFFFDFNNPVPKGTLRISGEKKLICQRYVHTTSGTKISSSNIWGGNTGLIPENII